MGRTYTGFLNDGHAGIPWQAIIMSKFVLDGPEITAKELIKEFGKDDNFNIYYALRMGEEKKWLIRVERGRYWLTVEGRKVWSRYLDSLRVPRKVVV